MSIFPIIIFSFCLSVIATYGCFWKINSWGEVDDLCLSNIEGTLKTIIVWNAGIFITACFFTNYEKKTIKRISYDKFMLNDFEI